MKKENQKILQKVIMMVVICFVMGGIYHPVKAETYDSRKTGSITIQLNDIETEMSNVGFACYQIAKVQEGNEMSWELLPEFQGIGVKINSLKTASDYRQAAKKLSEAQNKSKAEYVQGSTDAQGRLVFSPVKQGVYLIEQVDSAQYGKVLPYLVTVPYTEDGKEWIYDAKAFAKGETTEKPTSEVTSETTETTASSHTNNTAKPRKGSIAETSDQAELEKYAGMAAIAGIVIIIVGFIIYRKKISE